MLGALLLTVVASTARSSVLSEGWLFQPDPLAVGDSQRWSNPEFDRTGWRRVAVPMAWDFYDPVMDGYEGVGWYALELPRDRIVAGAWQRLRFNRANYRATVWIDGALSGENLNGYLPFEIPLTPRIRSERAIWIVVRVENGARYDRLPGTTTVEWVQYGGLLGAVELLTTGPACLAHVSIRAAPRGTDGLVSVDVDVDNSAETAIAGRVRFEADGRAAEADARIGPHASARISLALQLPDARLWSPDAPALYDAVTRLFDAGREIDALADRFGVRSIETAGQQILLNGRPLRIRGVNRYDELPGRGPVADEAEIRKDLVAVKEMGANLVRVHYPQSPLHLRIADEIGLLFMEEVPLNWWRAQWHPRPPRAFRNDKIIAVAEKALEQMILRDGNHPSVVIWSVANECETTDALGIRSMERLLRLAKALDPTRLATYVANRELEKNRAFGLADLVAINLYYGMWDGETADSLSQIDERVHVPTRKRLKEIASFYRDKPVLLTEFGTIGVPGSKGDLRFSETYQAAYVVAVWKAVEEVPEVSGGVVWCWADYRHHRGFTNEFPAYFGPFGLVTLERQPKAALAALRALWAPPY